MPAVGLIPALVGAPVLTSDDAAVGMVADLLVDAETGRPAWLVLRPPGPRRAGPRGAATRPRRPAATTLPGGRAGVRGGRPRGGAAGRPPAVGGAGGATVPALRRVGLGGARGVAPGGGARDGRGAGGGPGGLTSSNPRPRARRRGPGRPRARRPRRGPRGTTRSRRRRAPRG